MKEIVLDTASAGSMDEIHRELARLLHFPEHYGRNLDALYDCLSGETALPLRIVWRNYFLSRSRLGQDVVLLMNVLRDFAGEEPDFKIDVE